MKIYVNKGIDNGVCRASVRTDDFSCDDVSRMAKFGEPEFNAGGTISVGAPASVTGSADLSGGYDFSSVNRTFSVNVDGGGATTVTLTASCADLAAVVAHINARLGAVALDELVEAEESGTHVVLRTVYAGAGHNMVLAAGAPSDALSVLGVAPATYTGSGHDDYTLPNDLVRVKSDSPFVASFDSRDLTMDVAVVRGDMYVQVILDRIEAAMDDLRDDVDEYTDETMITY